MTEFDDPNINRVAEFSRAFDVSIAPDPRVPEFGDRTSARMAFYQTEAAQLAETLKTFAQQARDSGDEGGAMLLVRLQLCQEELAELAEAMIKRDIVECLDALTDMTYVCDGTFLALGLAHYKTAAAEEVHRSNMSKLGDDGKPFIAPSGRVEKGPSYVRPDLAAVLGMER